MGLREAEVCVRLLKDVCVELPVTYMLAGSLLAVSVSVDVTGATVAFTNKSPLTPSLGGSTGYLQIIADNEEIHLLVKCNVKNLWTPPWT